MKTLAEMAHEAGFYVQGVVTPKLERFAALVRAEALEEAASICELEAKSWAGDGSMAINETAFIIREVINDGALKLPI